MQSKISRVKEHRGYFFDKSKWLIFAFCISYLTVLVEFFNSERLSIIIPYALIIPFFITLPRIIYILRARKNGRGSFMLLSNIERALFVVVLLNAPASLFFHNMGFQYDRFLHLIMGVVYGYAFIFTLSMLIKYPENLMSGGSFSFLVFIGIAMLFLWEGGQFSIDTMTGTHLFSDKEQNIIQDFWEDIVFGFIGGMAVLFYLKNKWGKILDEQIQPK